MKTSINIKKMVSTLCIMVAFTSMTMSCQPANKSTADQEAVSEQKPSTDLFAASFMGNVKAIQQHVAIGANLDEKDQFGSTPLIIAITFNRYDAAKVLVENGASLTITSADGSSPLHTAAFLCRKDMVELLLKHGADKTALNQYGSTPYETVSGAFEDVQPIYAQLNKDLGPLGFKLDFDQLKQMRPVVADLLK